MKPVQFTAIAFGTDVDDAFRNAQELASCFHGVASAVSMKDNYCVIKPDVSVWTDKLKQAFAKKLLRKHDERVCRSRGPCGAIQLDSQIGLQVWLFFGWARVEKADQSE